MRSLMEPHDVVGEADVTESSANNGTVRAGRDTHRAHAKRDQPQAHRWTAKGKRVPSLQPSGLWRSAKRPDRVREAVGQTRRRAANTRQSATMHAQNSDASSTAGTPQASPARPETWLTQLQSLAGSQQQLYESCSSHGWHI